MGAVEITYFSDVLCIWAYISQARVDEVVKKFGARVRFDARFCSIFGDTARKIPTAWKDKGSYEGFNAHLHHVAERFPHIEIHPALWLETRPASSSSPHLFLKALQLGEHTQTFDKVAWALRCAFFRDCRDIAQWQVQCEIAKAFDVDIAALERRIHDGSAHAALATDYQDAEKMKIEGSPSFVMNAGRQKLYGNVGFHLIEANIRELMRTPGADDASWC
jgi:predicted DsbA family dithiol-disulfide isomerase